MKRCFLIILCCITIIGLFGCENKPIQNPSENGQAHITPDSMLPGETDINSESNHALTLKNIIIDDEAILPYDIGNAKVYSRDIIHIQPNSVVEAFSPYFALTYKDLSDKDGTYYEFKGQPKKSDMDILEGTFIFETPDSESINLLFHEEDDYTNNTNLFSVEEELSFMSRDDVLSKFKDILNCLDLNDKVDDDIKIYALSDSCIHEVIENESNRTGIAVKDLYPTGLLPECYVITATLQKDGITILPLTFNYHTQQLYMDRTIIKAIFSEKGIIYFTVVGYYPGEIKSNHECLSINDAIKCVDGIFDLVILNEKIHISKVQKIYMPTKNELVPVYAFRFEQDGLTDWIYINAVSGDRVI
jgi:hypothetical protein